MRNKAAPVAMTRNSALPIPNSALAIVALGSNLGESKTVVRSAMDRLQSLSDQPILRSSLWKSAPVDCPEGSPDFINAAVGLQPRPDETPESILKKLLQLELEFGNRPRLVVNAPRHLDLDLIAFGNATRAKPDLTLPHPRAHLREFVLKPLIEITPDYRLPGQTDSLQALLERIDASE